MPVTWVLVADRSQARLFSVSGEDTPITEIEDFVNPSGRSAGRELTRDRPPRTQDSHGEARHAIEPHTRPEDKSADQFAHELSAALERGWAGRRYDDLVLIAPPRFLGVLNAVLGEQVSARVTDRIAKELTHGDMAAIDAHLPMRLRHDRSSADGAR